MGIQIKLDASAVRELIKDNDEFRVELQRAVINEIVRQYIGKELPQAYRATIEAAVGQQLKQAVVEDAASRDHFKKAIEGYIGAVRNGWGGYSNQFKLSAAALKLINDAADLKIKDAVKEAVEARVGSEALRIAIDARFDGLKAESLAMIQRTYDQKFTSTVQAAVDQRWKAIATQVAGSQ
jgi:hypothetical protein